MDLLLIAALTAAVTSGITVLMWNIRRSRCTKCKSPCCTIERDLMSLETMKEDRLELADIGLWCQSEIDISLIFIVTIFVMLELDFNRHANATFIKQFIRAGIFLVFMSIKVHCDFAPEAEAISLMKRKQARIGLGGSRLAVINCWKSISAAGPLQYFF